MTPQSIPWTLSASWEPSSSRTSSGCCTSTLWSKELTSGCTSCGSWSSLTYWRQWWCTSTLPSSSPYSPPPSPSGTLLPLPKIKADCVSFALLRRLLACNLASLQGLYTSRTPKRAVKIVADPFHPGHKPFEALPLGRRLRFIKTKSSSHKNCLFPSGSGLKPTMFFYLPSWTLYIKNTVSYALH